MIDIPYAIIISLKKERKRRTIFAIYCTSSHRQSNWGMFLESLYPVRSLSIRFSLSLSLLSHLNLFWNKWLL